ncbi:hypothetical protein GCK72_014357 [Caenorhabditis remanei]|uniref:ABC transporter domain-containing protein n=1 Tax=Caenorhabditis remanei TaxID=31234 RepID=A0A6A5GR79_CAERE|nr:hypothetical protein GCK72_014357 [Caenorhabditis remanei]KAF1757900.1 hypothetical protein GCK72_014357 [Caenorhabditis remanei]
MSSVLSSVSSARRSIRSIWIKDLFYLRSNHPFFILIFIAIFLVFYNIWWLNAPVASEPPSETSKIIVYDNFRLTKHKFVRLMICIPPTVVDYRFSSVNDAIRLTNLEFPDLEFTKEVDKARRKLDDGVIDILILFNKLVETGRDIEYNIISQKGDLNKHYCIHCDNERKETWGNAVESQVIVNRFLYWVVRSRGFNHRRPHFQISNIYIKGTDSDPMYSKRQTDLFITWLLLLPICSRLIDLWNEERESGFYKMFLFLRARRFEYFIAKFVFWYGISLLISGIVLAVNVLIVPMVYSPTYVPFVISYAACITTFAIFLATLFPGSPFFAKFVGLLLMAAGEFGFGNVYQGITFFQLSVRFFGKIENDGFAVDAICLACMTVNCILMMALSIYLDTFFFSYTQEPLKFYFLIERAYWKPTPRAPKVDQFFIQQILTPREEKPEEKEKKPEDGKSTDKVDKAPSVKKEPVVKGPPKKPNLPLVILHGICKRINNQWKVNQVSLTIRLGEVTTFYGNHGCGSEEILSIISGRMNPEYGEVMMEKSQRPLVISMAFDVPIVNYFTVETYLEFVSRMRGVSMQSGTLKEMLKELDLVKVEDRSLDLLSTTQRERLRIAAAFAGEPDIVLIDWPTKESLPDWKYMILRFIEKRKEKRSIIISSYDAEETETISDKVVLLSEGFVVMNGSCERIQQSIESVFEIRLWPVNIFTDDQITGMIDALTLGDPRMRNEVKFFETPNGKIRITLPVIFRRSISLILQELEAVAAQYQIAFIEINKPNIHDVYTNSVYEPRQYEPLANYEQLKEYYSKQERTSRTIHFFKNMVRILKDKQFLFQAVAISVLFFALALLTLISFYGTKQHFTHEISFESHDFPITIYCDDCYKEESEQVTFVKKSGSQQLADNQAVVYWKKKSALSDLELVSVSRGDDTFTMIIQNYVMSLMVSKLTGKYPQIKTTLENGKFRASSTKSGFSTVFNDVNKNQAAMILSESYALIYMLGVFQTFVYTLSAILPLRLVSVNMRLNSHLFPWPRYLYFGLLFAANIAVFLVLSIILIVITLIAGFFSTSTASCFFSLFGAWFMSYVSTLPLIYLLVFSVNNPMAVIPTVMAVSSLLVSLPNMVSSFSAENQISLQSLLQFVSWVCMISPPTSLQVLAAFLNAGEFLEDNRGTIRALILFCGAQFLVLMVFAVCVFQPGFSLIRQHWFTSSTAVKSVFERGTTLKPGARIKNSFVFSTINGGTTGETGGEKPSIGDTPSRSVAGGEEVESKISSDNLAANSTSIEDMSYITNYEEHLIEKMSSMKRWDNNQELPVDNSATYLLGDQTVLKSSLLKTIAETNTTEQVAYVPYTECLPILYTPFELLENVAACHGFEVTEDHINYLLNAFDMKSLATTPIKLLTDSDRRILMLLTKLVIKPSIVILDQLEMFLPHPKMMTVWALCARLRADGVGIIYTSRNNSFAEHTATSCAHVYKCQFMNTHPSASIKAGMGCTILEVVPNAETETDKLLKMLLLSMPDATVMPSANKNVLLNFRKDDAETMNMIVGIIRSLSTYIQSYSIRSGNFDEFVASAFGK